MNNIYLSPVLLESALKGASALCKSQIVPKDYQNNPGNCLIAIELAGRWNVSPLMVMQGMPIIHGRPGLEGKFALALLKANLAIEDYGWTDVGTKGQNSQGKEFWVKYKDGKLRTGTPVTLQLAIDFGWMGKAGSAWKTQPEQMLVYRSVNYFIRQWEPGVLMGMHTKDEVEDMVAIDVTPRVAPSVAPSVNLSEVIKAEAPAEREPVAAVENQRVTLSNLLDSKYGLKTPDDKRQWLSVKLAREIKSVKDIDDRTITELIEYVSESLEVGGDDQ